MPRRTLLSTEQRTRLFAIPIDPADMARYYALNTEDLTVIRAKRRSVNRLGFAIQLCLLRYPGQGLGPDERPPQAMIVFIARQLGVSPATFADYALRDQTRREHAVELQQHLRLRNFRLSDWTVEESAKGLRSIAVIFLNGTSVLLPTMLQQLMNYPVVTTGPPAGEPL